MAGLANSRGIFCSATLLSEYWVLTAAHCPIDFPSDFVRVGAATESEGTIVEVDEVFIHPDYVEKSGLRNDVQLVKLKSAVPKDSKFVVLNSDSSYPAPFSFTRTSGYGDSKDTSSPDSGVLREVDVPVVGNKRCRRQYNGVFNIRKRMHICAGYDEGGCDSCQGDSGGPLYTFTADRTLVQVGVVSFGLNCADAKSPGVYARVSQYIDWMKSVGAEFQTTTAGINVFSADDIPSESTPTPTPTSTPSPTPTATPAPTPSPSPAAEVSFFEQLINCFSRNLFITTDDGSRKRVTDLSAGERVRFGKNGDSRIFQFQEEDNGVLKFLQVECKVCEALILPFCS
ncbi:Trypsin [Gracilaria domingensis]|nr:Trypsin [Gracilaria domingensis]